MDFQTLLILAQDGLTSSAIYMLLAIAMILIFGATRILFVPQGEFVSYGALTLASLQLGAVPGTIWLLLLLALAAAVVETVILVSSGSSREVPWTLVKTVIPPVAIAVATYYCAPMKLALGWQVLLSILIVTAMGPLVYRIVFRPLADSSILILLIAAVAVHFVLVGSGLLFFGPEGVRTPTFSDAQWTVGPLMISGQSVCVYVITIILIALLAWFFGKTVYGKALRAVAFNRHGARLVGISPGLAGTLSFAVAAAIGGLSGILIGPITTVYYDSGFLIGLKGFAGAIVGGLGSYPLAAVGAMIIGFLESYSSFWVSAYKDVIVFTLIIPILLFRSLTTVSYEEEEY
jgi:branched-chain amino acid transport system permease protein